MLPDLSNGKVVIALGLTITALYLALALGRTFTKQPVCDEAWYSQPASNLASGKGMGTTVLETAGTPRTGLERHTYWQMPLFIVAQSVWYTIFGFGLFRLRLFCNLWGLVFLFAWFALIRKVFQNNLVALLACGIMAVDFEIVNVAATGRSDIMCAALGAAGLATYLLLRDRHFSLSLILSNALIVCSGLTHPNGLIYFVVFAILLISYDHRKLRLAHFGFMAVPYFAGALLWGLYVLQAPGDFMAQFGAASHRLWGLSSPLKAVAAEVARYRFAYGLDAASRGLRRLKIVFLVAGVAAVLGIMLRPAARKILAVRLWFELTAIVFLLMTVYEGAKQEWYLIHIIPFFAVLLALLVLMSWRKRLWVRGVTLALFLTVPVMDVLLLGRLIHNNDYQRKYEPAVAFLKQHETPSSLVMGSSELMFGLTSAPPLDDYRLGFYSQKQPQFIVIDPNYREMFVQYSLDEPAVYEHVQTILRTRCTMMFDNGYYSIYQLHQVRQQ